MKLISCYIENFGLIHTAEYHFKKDLDCQFSDNGTGKTTLTAFIEAMLYGIGDGRKQTLDENPRKKYLPWQGGRYGGSLTLEVGKKKYVIERTFGSKPADDVFKLIDADSGRISEDYTENIGEELFGIDRDGFLRTAFLSEKNLRGKNENKSISAKLSDLVGVDGDVGGFDAAIKLLDEKRKFLYKKGNTGEIANVKQRIRECERRIDELEHLGEDTDKKEVELKKLIIEQGEVQAKKRSVAQRLEILNAQRERKGHEEAYASMLKELYAEKERLKKAEQFFAAGIPTFEEIDVAREYETRSVRLKSEALSERGNEEYILLDSFFKNKTSYPEIDDAERTASLIEDKERALAEIESGTDSATKEMYAIFPEGVPTREDVEKAKKEGKRDYGKMAVIALFSALGTVGFLLGGIFKTVLSPIAFIISAIIALSVLIGGKGKKELSILDKYLKSGRSLASIETGLDRYEQLERERDGRRAEIYEEKTRLTVKVCDFLGKFPLTDADSMLDAVRTIKHKYNQYYAFSMASEINASDKLGKLKESERLFTASREFLAKYPTTTNNPFSEIRDMLTAYNQFKSNVQKQTQTCDEYAVRHGVSGASTSLSFDDEVALKSELDTLANSEKELEGKILVCKRDIGYARNELEQKDEYDMQLETLKELHDSYVEKLSLITSTSQYLTEACDNITSKYLGKTKERFEEYSRLIAGVDGEYTLNTSFEITRSEKGETHGIDSYSRGMRDLYALGLRLALVDALYENEAPFIILDDPFIAFDDEKLARAKATLKAISKTKQILYFTCSSAREIK